MRVYPVIMCGGSGTRLWPESRASRPKQFLPLLGDISTFQETARRVMAVSGAETLVVVAGAAHETLIREQLSALGLSGSLLLEPKGRDSAPAIAAAALWVQRQDPEAAVVVVAADHHIPDEAAFTAAIEQALKAAAQGGITTLGLRPTRPETGFGYIRPAPDASPVKPVAAFVEKPDEARAVAYVADGYLWNTGMFIAKAAVLLDDIQRFEPEVRRQVELGMAQAVGEAGVVRLGPAFLEAPKISIDYAVMERTERARVLPVDFSWTDLGSWAAVWDASARDANRNVAGASVQAVQAEGCLVRAAPGIQVGLVDVSDLAVIAEPDAVLVTSLRSSQRVKELKAASQAQDADPFNRRSPLGMDLQEVRTWLRGWLATSALPLWSSLGYDHARGGFAELIEQSGRAAGTSRRARVQARQCFVLASAASAGFEGPWLTVAKQGWADFVRDYRKPDGFFRGMVDRQGEPLTDEVRLYDQAFALLALASLHAAEPDEPAYLAQAEQILGRLQAWRHGPGFREQGDRPFQANAQMHLLEASLAWAEASGGKPWRELAASLAQLAADRFFVRDAACLLEVFDADWRPAAGDEGRFMEPGHQFEWAWLMHRYGRVVGDDTHQPLVGDLYRAGLTGIDAARRVAMDELWSDRTVRSANARLWPQTEWLKAACIAPASEEDTRLAAAHAMLRYLATPVQGLWRDKMTASGALVEEAAPASSFYHLFCAIRELDASA